MKFFMQNGSKLERTNLSESDHVCLCCQGYDHAATEYHHDDAVCQKCNSLCCCGCHREIKAAVIEDDLVEE